MEKIIMPKSVELLNSYSSIDAIEAEARALAEIRYNYIHNDPSMSDLEKMYEEEKLIIGFPDEGSDEEKRNWYLERRRVDIAYEFRNIMLRNIRGKVSKKAIVMNIKDSYERLIKRQEDEEAAERKRVSWTSADGIKRSDCLHNRLELLEKILKKRTEQMSQDVNTMLKQEISIFDGSGYRFRLYSESAEILNPDRFGSDIHLSLRRRERGKLPELYINTGTMGEFKAINPEEKDDVTSFYKYIILGLLLDNTDARKFIRTVMIERSLLESRIRRTAEEINKELNSEYYAR